MLQPYIKDGRSSLSKFLQFETNSFLTNTTVVVMINLLTKVETLLFLSFVRSECIASSVSDNKKTSRLLTPCYLLHALSTSGVTEQSLSPTTCCWPYR